MRLLSVLLPVIGTMVILSGCALGPTARPISTTVAITSKPTFEGAVREGASATDLSVVGQSEPPLFRTLLSVRECSAGKCAAGIAKPTLGLSVQRVAAGQAAIHFTAATDIGEHQSLKWQSGNSRSETTIAIPSGVPMINDHFAIDRVATIKIGEFRHVALPHGLRAYVCVAIPDANGMTDGSCDFSRIQTTKGAELEIPAL